MAVNTCPQYRKIMATSVLTQVKDGNGGLVIDGSVGGRVRVLGRLRHEHPIGLLRHTKHKQIYNAIPEEKKRRGERGGGGGFY